MSRIRIAVSGAGGGAGQSILKSLQLSDYEVIALDGEALGTGLYTTDRSFVIPYSSDPSYLPTLLKLCQDENISIYFPGLDAELPILSQNVEKFQAIGATVIVSSPDVVELGDNKLVTFKRLTDLGFNVPNTLDMSSVSIDDISFGYPFILKQREGGARSQNLYLIKSRDELDGLISNGIDIRKFIAQEYIDGEEYTCGTVNLGGICKGVIVMRRILRDGDTYKCFVVRDHVIEREVESIVNAIKPFGACNVQLRVRDGKVYVFEINARCSGTTAARSLSGFNEPKSIAEFISHGIEPTFNVKEQTILRYWKELVVSNELVKEMQSARQLRLDSHELL